MTLVIASAHLSDEEFMAAFSSCNLPLSSFRHSDHLRLAWIQLHRNTFEIALELVREGIQRYAAYNKVPHIFHETVTSAWVKLLATHREPDFATFVRENEPRLKSRLLHQFWTPEVLDSQAARLNWLPPDKAALPN